MISIEMYKNSVNPNIHCMLNISANLMFLATNEGVAEHFTMFYGRVSIQIKKNTEKVILSGPAHIGKIYIFKIFIIYKFQFQYTKMAKIIWLM